MSIDLGLSRMLIELIVILRACDFSIFSCFLYIQPAVFQCPDKAVILSEALRRSIANRGLCGAESKDLEDEHLIDAVRSFSTTEAREQDSRCGTHLVVKRTCMAAENGNVAARHGRMLTIF